MWLLGKYQNSSALFLTLQQGTTRASKVGTPARPNPGKKPGAPPTRTPLNLEGLLQQKIRQLLTSCKRPAQSHSLTSTLNLTQPGPPRLA